MCLQIQLDKKTDAISSYPSLSWMLIVRFLVKGSTEGLFPKFKVSMASLKTMGILQSIQAPMATS